MQPEPFNLLDPSHIIFAALCIALVVYLPRIFIGSSEKTIRNVKYFLAFLMISHEIIDPFFKVAYFDELVKDSLLPAYVCVFNVVYFNILARRPSNILLLFAYFWE
ncbi:MAG: hypothetical protein CM15mP31_4740 [Gammaproteobacteria bacterium]|nr:MAG: hypothetical protein CM15mP31_4740 [Gammaproteobacteria bacterium]